MKKNKKTNSFLSVCLSLSVILGNFTLPILAYGRESKSPSSSLLITQKEKTGLEKFQQIEGKRKNYVEGEVLVKYRKNKINLETVSGRAAALDLIRSKSLEKREDLKKVNISVLKIKDEKTVEQKIAELKKDPNVEYVEPNYKRYPATISTNDTNRGLLWGLDNTGQSVNGVIGATDADIDAPEAWAISEAATYTTVVVAIIDSGVAYNHPDLLSNMWDGASCKDENGVAIAGGCNHGYDYEDDDNTPLPTTSSHGTHIAGTIGAVKNNDRGIVGVVPQVKIMAIKYGNDTVSEIKGIDFAIQNGAKIVNASFGGADFSQSEYDAINRFKIAGRIFIAAAGNYGDNNENNHFYPSDYDLDNIISVAATDQSDHLASFSNYGSTSVDVGAPGTNIYSTEGYRIFDEDFEGVTPPDIGTKFNQSGSSTWGTLSNGLNKAVFGDYVNWGDYQNNITSHIDSSVINLSGKPDSYLNFTVVCDSEPGYDGIILYFWDGSTWIAQSTYSGSDALLEKKSLSSFAIDNFKFRFTWLANESNPISYNGCYVDNVKIIDSASTNDSYQFMNGTSMAAPHVAGLAALIEGYNPSLTLSQVKNAILTTGDSLAGLDGKTVSGKRINAQKALQAVNSAKAITSFNFEAIGVTGTIDETAHTITATVPFGTDVTALVPTIVITGVSISPLSEASQDFTNPVVYTVTAADSSTQTYTVTVIFDTNPDIALVAADKADLVDSLIQGANPDLSNITTALTNPLPSLGANGSTITWGSSNPSIVSNDGQTINRPAFSDGDATVVMTATLTKGIVSDTKAFTLTVLKLPASSIATIISDIYIVSASGTASETITNVPFGTAKTTFLAALIKGEPNQTWNDAGISDPIATGNTLIVTAEDGITAVTYTITTVPGKTITAFSFEEGVGVINEHDKTIAVTVPFGTDVTALVPTIVITGVSVSPPSGQLQDFTNPVEYTVTAEDGSTQTYTVTVIVALNSAKAITSFDFITPPAAGVIDEAANTISITVPFGTDITALIPTIVITGTSVNPASGEPQNFTSPVIYTVTAEDGSVQIYTVTLTQDANPDFALLAADKADLADGLIKGENPDLANITVALTNPLPFLGANGSTITWVSSDPSIVSNDGQTITRPNFSSVNAVVTLTATLVKGIVSDTKSFTLTVLKLPPSAVAIITSATYTVSAQGTANETITNVPFGTAKAAFLAALVKSEPNQTWVDTGINDPVATGNTLIVRAEDGITAVTYIITVNIAPGTATPNESGVVTADTTAPQVVITNPTQAVTLTISSGTTNPTIDVSSFIQGGAGTLPQITIVSANAGNIHVSIPASTLVSSADPIWDGIIAAPTVTTVTLPDTAGETKTLSTAIEIGNALAKLSFDKAVRLLLPNEAGKRAGYIRTGITFTEITNTCAADDQTAGDALAADGDCKISVGSDLVIWTKHFTKFAAYTQTVIPPSPQSSSGGGGGGGGGGASTPTPTDISAPTGVSVVINDGADTTTSRTVNLTLSASDSSSIQTMISNDPAFSSASWENFSTVKTWLVSDGDGVKTVYVKFKDSYNNTSSTVSDSIVLSVPKVTKKPKIQPQVLGAKTTSPSESQLFQLLTDAADIYSANINAILSNAKAARRESAEKSTADKYLSNLIRSQKGLTPPDINRLNFFVTYGTSRTKILGAGERAGVLDSYKSAFHKLPKTETEWQDAMKIAGGRWPTERNATAETKAKAAFKKIYGRDAKMSNANDNAAVTVMAYGLRIGKRNLNSEKAAIFAFRYFVKRLPTTAVDWGMVRAIAYSGAKR